MPVGVVVVVVVVTLVVVVVALVVVVVVRVVVVIAAAALEADLELDRLALASACEALFDADAALLEEVE